VGQTPTTWRPRYWPQVGHAWCGGVSAPHARFGQTTRVGTLAFHCDLRERVLLRDIFLFGTATIDLLLCYFDQVIRLGSINRTGSRPVRALG